MAKLTYSDFVEEMKIKNPNIEIMGEYVNIRTNIACKCRVCGNVWSPRPDTLRKGASCPKCIKNRQTKSHDNFVKEMYDLCPTIKILGRYINNRKKYNVYALFVIPNGRHLHAT